MKLSLKELLVAVAVVSLAFGFALHVRSTKRQLNEFESNMRHASAERDFEFRMSLVEENFRRAGYLFLEDLSNDQIGPRGGTFERKYGWSTEGKPAVSGSEFCDELRPLIYGFTSSQHISWTVETNPTLRQIQTAPDQTSGTIVFVVNYQLH